MASSSKLRAAKRDQGEELSIDMSPMIDMVFLLLIFFLVNATMIIVKQDPNVDPPVAKNSVKAEEGKGRIVINVYEDGDLFSEEGERLESDEAVFDLVKSQKEDVLALGYEPKLHLRGDREAVFKHSRRVIRISAEAGVDQVMFATYGFDAY